MALEDSKTNGYHGEINQGYQDDVNKRALSEFSNTASEKQKIDFQDKILTEDTTCGIWIFKGEFLQKFANKKTYVFLYGVLGCLFSATGAYYNGTISTLEKRFKIPSKTTGIISVGNDISQLLVSVVISYYTGRKHRPRWMALGLYIVVLFCLLSAFPHWLYGAGKDALLLTTEFGSTYDYNTTREVLIAEQKKTLCHSKNSTSHQCETEGGNYAPQVILFIAQFISGMGAPLYYTLGVTYMDDNIKKSKTPALISFSYFLRMLGPPIGYALASVCLKMYISPGMVPTITNIDPRWLGAWWLGWIILAVLLFVFGSLLALFPKTLPRAAARKEHEESQENEKPTSLKDMAETFKRLIKNPILMMNNFAAIFYFLGYMPYWIFLPKYIETQYRQSASASSLITGTVGLIFSAIGVLLSGLVISRFKPRARYLAGWNVVVGLISMLGIVSYAFLGCAENYNRLPLLPSGELNPTLPCNIECDCDYVKYNPVCSSDEKTTFISACHAGCKMQELVNGTKIYKDCACVPLQQPIKISEPKFGGTAHSGNCFVDCLQKFYIFLAVVCILKFTGATGRASNFLVTVRAVDEKDKAVAIGFGLTMMSLCAFVPSPILFGVILDNACLVWGKTCSGNGNCWLYNGEILRYTMNFTAATFVTIGTLFDVGVWYFVKGLKIFEEEVDEPEIDNTSPK